MGRKKKRRDSVKLTAYKRFKKSRSRRIYPAFQNTTFVFCGDWGGASTSMKLSVSARAEIGSFRKVGTALHCLPLSCLLVSYLSATACRTAKNRGRFTYS